MKQYPIVSIVFPNYNGGRQSLECVASIAKLSYSQNKLEVIVVDNNSTDGSVEKILKLKTKNLKLKIIRNKKNEGFAKAVNRGVKISSGNYLFITNNDVVLERNCLENLLLFLLDHQDVGVVGAITYDRNKLTILHPAPRYNFYFGVFYDSKDTNTTQEADWIPGSGLCTSRILWEKLGGFDEGFFFTYEDLDFCLRAKKLGYKIIYYPKAILWHSDGATINRPEFVFFKYYQGYSGKLRLLLKHANFLQITSSIFLQIVIFLPYRTLILKEKSAIPFFKSFIWNAMHLRDTIAKRREVNAIKNESI